jgi:hypothetical protein
MAALIDVLDNYTTTQIGENGHVEYGWSNNMREKIAQFSFQLTRTGEEGLKALKGILYDILDTLKHTLTYSSISEKKVAKGYLSVLYRIIGHTRDIIDGKGEYTLTYMMIHTWYNFYPELSLFALRCLVDIGNKKVHPYGSWKDMKYFCQYCKSNGENIAHPLIQSAIKIINEQLKNDYANYISNTNDISLVAKWVPREKSSFGWLYRELATDYFSHFLETASSDIQLTRATLKCKTEYRKLLSSINKHIDTLQIKQCSKKWCCINFDNVTSISLSKQKKAFLNVKQNGEIRFPDSMDRIDCSKRFNDHIKRAVDGEFELKGKRVGMADFTKQAIGLIRNNNQIETDLLNSQWRDNATQSKELGKMIAMVDVSGSMEGDPMNAAIAIGIRIAEKSIIGKRVMTFSAKPTWVNLDGYDDFVSQVDIITRAEWGMNTNFHAALDTILDAIIQNKMDPEDVQDLVLVILSDMQMDSGDNCNKQVLYDIMKAKYEAAGIRVHGKPYKPPHILFWNLRSTSGFPTLSNQRNCSMMSGFSPGLLNIFCDQGLNALQACTPWSLLEKSLENDRYKIMADKIN